MQPGTYSLERSLEDCLNDAIQKAVKNPCGKDPFGSALRTSMDTFALHLPVCLQQDGITTRETLPASRNVTVTSVSNEDPNKKTSHPLISAVDQGVIVLNQPIFYTVKNGDTLSEISWKLTGRKASVRDLKNWNTIWGDLIKPGQVLYLADPYDPFVKEIASKLSKYELTGRNPKISLDRLSDEMVARHGGLFGEKHQVEIRLEFRESPEEFLSAIIVNAQQDQINHWGQVGAEGNDQLTFTDDHRHNLNEVNQNKDVSFEDDSGDENLLGQISRIIGIGGSTWGAYDEFGHNHTTYKTTKGLEKNIYKTNGRVRSARAAKFARTSNAVKAISYGFIGAGLALDFYGILNFYFSTDPNSYTVHPVKGGFNTIMTAVSVYGGVIGTGVGGVYFIIDATIGWDNALDAKQNLYESNKKLGIDPFDTYSPKW